MGVRYIFGQDGAFRTEPVIVAKNITENGTYDPATDNADGYAPVTVNVEGGGSSWQTVYEGSVTTTAHTMPGGETSYTSFIDTDNPITSATIKVTFNGVEYTCPFMDNEYYGSPDNEFSEYPFMIQPNGLVATQTAGTYTLKIEEQSGGGSSDFSTATLTITRGEFNDGRFYVPNLATSPLGTSLFPIINDSEGTNNYEVVVYSGGTVLTYDGTYEVAVSGDIQAMGGGTYLITGNGTITIS